MVKFAGAIAALAVVAGLGVAVMPLSSYALQESREVTVSVTVDDTLGFMLDTDKIDFGKVTTDGQINDNQSVTATVTTSESTYSLTATPLNGQTALVSTTDNSKTIASTAGGLSDSGSAWGIKGGDVADWSGFAASNSEIKLRNGAANTTAETKIDFGVKVVSGQSNGTYTGGIVLTATAGA